MKKSLLSLVGIAALSALFLGGGAYAQLDISDLFYESTPLFENTFVKILNEYDNTRGYSDDSLIKCNSNGGVSITVPAIDDGYLDKVKKYRLFFSPYRISQLRIGDSSADISKVMMKEITIDDNASDVNFSISPDDINPNTAYYSFIVPIDSYDGVGIPSKETCFQTASSICLQDTACDTLELVINPIIEEDPIEDEDNQNSHGAASCVGMDMANVSHTMRGDTITLTWTAVAGDTVEIAIFDPNLKIYKSLGSVSMNSEKFSYKIQWDGEQNFALTNGCRELYYKADAVKQKTKTVEPVEEIVPAATGPAENILYIIIAAVVIYGAYAIFARRSED